MSISSPQSGPLSPSNSVNHRAGKRESLLQPHRGRFESQIRVQINHDSPLHGGDGRKRVIFSPLPKHDLKDLVDAHRGDDQQIGILDRLSKEISVGFIGKTGQPSR